jgi:hypothetical protein
MTKIQQGFTKQGVRDLDQLPGAPRRRQRPMAPRGTVPDPKSSCRHDRRRPASGAHSGFFEICLDCPAWIEIEWPTS